MKPFNLKEYLENPSKKVVTRDGHNVRIICTDHDNISYPIVGAIKGYEFPFCFSEDGCVVGSKCNDVNDLFFAPEKHEGWIIINKYPDGVRDTNGIIYHTKSDVPNITPVGVKRIATIKIEWEE